VIIESIPAFFGVETHNFAKHLRKMLAIISNFNPGKTV